MTVFEPSHDPTTCIWPGGPIPPKGGIYRWWDDPFSPLLRGEGQDEGVDGSIVLKTLTLSPLPFPPRYKSLAGRQSLMATKDAADPPFPVAEKRERG